MSRLWKVLLSTSGRNDHRQRPKDSRFSTKLSCAYGVGGIATDLIHRRSQRSFSYSPTHATILRCQ